MLGEGEGLRRAGASKNLLFLPDLRYIGMLKVPACGKELIPRGLKIYRRLPSYFKQSWYIHIHVRKCWESISPPSG